MYRYELFGLHVASELQLHAIGDKGEPSAAPDVTIKFAVCPEITERPFYGADWFQTSKHQMRMKLEDVGTFYAENGNTIMIEPFPGVREEVIGMYVLGACFSAILYHRGVVAIHGSCVSKAGKVLIITGDSGCGKSTMATKFLLNGWNLISDDVTPIYVEDGICYAQATYPGQKLWQDAIERSQGSERVLSGLLREDNGLEKFQLQADEYFNYDRLPITHICMLTKGTDRLCTSEVTGFPKTDLLLRNIYRRYMAQDQEGQQNQLLVCMTLASQLRAFLVERPEEERTEQQIYQYLVNEMEN